RARAPVAPPGRRILQRVRDAEQEIGDADLRRARLFEEREREREGTARPPEQAGKVLQRQRSGPHPSVRSHPPALRQAYWGQLSQRRGRGFTPVATIVYGVSDLRSSRTGPDPGGFRAVLGHVARWHST